MRFFVYFWEKLLLLGAILGAIKELWPLCHLIPASDRAYGRWLSLSHWKRGIIVGLFMAVMMHIFQDAESLRRIEDTGLDWMIRMYRGVSRNATSDIPPITFLNVDEATYRAWDEPLYLPREKLKQLIQYGVEGQAALVIVDVELTRSMGAQDDALKDYLNTFHGKSENPTEVILARGLRSPAEAGGMFEQRISFVDEVVRGNPHVHWAAPLYDMDDDGIVRRWLQWAKTCSTGYGGQGPHIEAIPSVQLLATLLLKDKNADYSLQQYFQGKFPLTCDEPETGAESSKKESFHSKGVSFSFEGEHLASRILYSLPWRLKAGERYPSVAWLGDPSFPLFTAKPAIVVTESDQPPPSSLKGQIVIIGASYGDSRDIYSTPLGMMPGSMIIANSILSFYQSGEAREWPLLKNTMELLLIVVCAIVFAWLPGFYAKLLASLVTLAAVLPLSFYLFKSGVWLDFAIPLAAVEFHAMFGEFEKKLEHARNKMSH